MRFEANLGYSVIVGYWSLLKVLLPPAVRKQSHRISKGRLHLIMLQRRRGTEFTADRRLLASSCQLDNLIKGNGL